MSGKTIVNRKHPAGQSEKGEHFEMDFNHTMKMMKAWNTFQQNHPKFSAFCRVVMNRGIRPGSVIEIAVTTPEGERMETNLKVKEEDLELLQSLKNGK